MMPIVSTYSDDESVLGLVLSIELCKNRIVNFCFWGKFSG
jgi:hypothetical protein